MCIRDSFLHAEALRDDANKPGQLADPDDLLMGDVPDVGPAEERQDVVLAQGEERNRPFYDLGQLAVGSAMTFGRERRQELGIPVVAVRCVKQRTDEAAWRLSLIHISEPTRPY